MLESNSYSKINCEILILIKNDINIMTKNHSWGNINQIKSMVFMFSFVQMLTTYNREKYKSI